MATHKNLHSFSILRGEQYFCSSTLNQIEEQRQKNRAGVKVSFNKEYD